jgi:hypothetical protein
MKRYLALAAILITPLITHAEVNPKNGNFFISYSDAVITNGQHTLDITRTYNSKSINIGWFGYGWGSKFETKLVVLPDGSAYVQENGTGRYTYYRNENEIALKSGIQTVVNAAVTRDKLSPQAAEKLFIKLLNNEELRNAKVKELGVHTDLLIGTALDGECGKGARRSLGME